MIEIRRLSFRYKPDLEPVLKDISISFQPGESVAIIGAEAAQPSAGVGLPAVEHRWCWRSTGRSVRAWVEARSSEAGQERCG